MNFEISAKEIGQKIYFIRGHRVMLDVDLALLYAVPVKRINEQVKRNPLRFPSDFMFQLTREEHQFLRSQNATLDEGRGKYTKYLPFVFTEQGVAMLSSVLRSDRAAVVNVAIMRAFVQLRRVFGVNKDLAKKLDEIEKKLLDHDEDIESAFEAIRRLMATGSPVTQKRIVPPGRE